MTDTRPVFLGGRTFDVPVLPLRVNRVVYPLCRALTIGEDSFFSRVIAADGSVLAVTDEELETLATIAFGAAQAADKELTQEAFEDLPITPVQLLDAFFAIRIQTGVWTAAKQTAGDESEGEA